MGTQRDYGTSNSYETVEKRISPIGYDFTPPRSPQRFHCHFRSLFENLNIWSQLALTLFSGKT
jgi:hypothetical protein